MACIKFVGNNLYEIRIGFPTNPPPPSLHLLLSSFLLFSPLLIVVVGASGSGKTCIINRFAEETYRPDTPATIGGMDSKTICLVNHGEEPERLILDRFF